MFNERVPVPPRFQAGALIGRGGSNIKSLERLSGCRFWAEDPFLAVSVSGYSQEAVSEAVRLLQLQFKHLPQVSPMKRRRQCRMKTFQTRLHARRSTTRQHRTSACVLHTHTRWHEQRSELHVWGTGHVVQLI